ncbi:cyclic nucleotide-binding domain-containing protein [Candidatus Peregrinibacteria bacterium]|nr:cyclic nucleotide-binding domain-containing protein [Candidatus Peregrinibacteria bacterium]MCB9804978.1 cyclic nucleotide-binding domain-containing protein [Candidatus Peribacteria bacterium]
MATLTLFSEEQILVPHETLFRQGDEANALYIVMDGKLEVYKNTPQ